MSRNIKEAMSRLGERATVCVPEPEPLSETDIRNEHIETLQRYMGDLNFELFDDDAIELMANTLAQTLKGKQRDIYGREQMYANRLSTSLQIRVWKPCPDFVVEQHLIVVRENNRVDRLNRKLMTEQDYNKAMGGKEGYDLLIAIPYPNAWKSARERAHHIETSALLEEWQTRRRWWKNVSEGRVNLRSDNKMIYHAKNEVLE